MWLAAAATATSASSRAAVRSGVCAQSERARLGPQGGRTHRAGSRASRTARATLQSARGRCSGRPAEDAARPPPVRPQGSRRAIASTQYIVGGSANTSSTCGTSWERVSSNLSGPRPACTASCFEDESTSLRTRSTSSSALVQRDPHARRPGRPSFAWASECAGSAQTVSIRRRSRRT